MENYMTCITRETGNAHEEHASDKANVSQPNHAMIDRQLILFVATQGTSSRAQIEGTAK